MIEILKKAALIGSDVLKKYSKQNVQVSLKKNLHDLVTLADNEAEYAIISYIKKEMKNQSINNFGFIGEESGYKGGEYMFIIDPLDGTMNFATGIDYYCISIALAKNNQIINGVVYEVTKNNFYWAEKGRGAYKNNKKLTIPNNKKLEEAVVFFYFSSRQKVRERLLNIIKQIGEKIRGMRLMGSTALDLCRISEGIGDMNMNLNAHIWDIAASCLILEEAQGISLNLEGKKVVLNINELDETFQMISGEKNLLLKLLTSLKKTEANSRG